jgi:hypothetical protein
MGRPPDPSGPPSERVQRTRYNSSYTFPNGHTVALHHVTDVGDVRSYEPNDTEVYWSFPVGLTSGRITAFADDDEALVRAEHHWLIDHLPRSS